MYTAIPQKSVCASAVFVPKISAGLQRLAMKKVSMGSEKEDPVINANKTAAKISLQKTVATRLTVGRTPVKVNAYFANADQRNLHKDCRRPHGRRGAQTPKYKTSHRNRKTLRKDFPQDLPETYTLWDLIGDSLVN